MSPSQPDSPRHPREPRGLHGGSDADFSLLGGSWIVINRVRSLNKVISVVALLITPLAHELPSRRGWSLVIQPRFKRRVSGKFSMNENKAPCQHAVLSRTFRN